DRNRSHWSTSKTPSYTKSVSWQHHPQRYPPKYAKDQSVKAYRYAYGWPLTAMLRVIQWLSPGEADLFLELARSV
ncbi:hypothetical protein, partial [Klebsiella pneumoniae]|uniref:hypothetical protein n=1 Tax=Klebsiella pneumoniae TaxID=573 RepID=UPI001B3C1498